MTEKKKHVIPVTSAPKAKTAAKPAAVKSSPAVSVQPKEKKPVAQKKKPDQRTFSTDDVVNLFERIPGVSVTKVTAQSKTPEPDGAKKAKIVKPSPAPIAAAPKKPIKLTPSLKAAPAVKPAKKKGVSQAELIKKMNANIASRLT